MMMTWISLFFICFFAPLFMFEHFQERLLRELIRFWQFSSVSLLSEQLIYDRLLQFLSSSLHHRAYAKNPAQYPRIPIIKIPQIMRRGFTPLRSIHATNNVNPRGSAPGIMLSNTFCTV